MGFVQPRCCSPGLYFTEAWRGASRVFSAETCDSGTFVQYQCDANRTTALVWLYSDAECGTSTGYLRSSVPLMTCVASADYDVLDVEGEEDYWFIMICDLTASLDNFDIYTYVYYNDVCDGLPSFDFESSHMSQCNCDQHGLHNSSEVLYHSPPCPPLPPNPPEAPPITIVNGSEVIIDDPEYAQDHFEDTLNTETVMILTISTEVFLYRRLPVVNRTLLVQGSCNSSSEPERGRCLIDGSQPGSIFHVSTGGALRLEHLELTNQHATKFALGGVLSVLGDLSSAPRPSAELVDCVLHNSRATDRGGAAYVEAGFLQMLDVVLENNVGFHGGAVAGYDATIVVRNSTLTGNAADEGAGLYILESNLTLADRVAVTHNVAQQLGGGLYCRDCVAVIDGGSQVAHNEVVQHPFTSGTEAYGGDGGGAYLKGSGELDLAAAVRSGASMMKPDKIGPGEGQDGEWEGL
eukprot:gene4682-5731_t